MLFLIIFFILSIRKSFCPFCPLGKSHRLPFALSSTIYKSPLELVIYDILGPSPIISNNQFRYYILFLDAYSHFNWIFPLNSNLMHYNHFFILKQRLKIFSVTKLKSFKLMVAMNFKNSNLSLTLVALNTVFLAHTLKNKMDLLKENTITLLKLDSPSWPRHLFLFIIGMMPFTLPIIF